MVGEKQIQINAVNWCQIIAHPSEFVRIDEQLRLKYLELSNFVTSTNGWTKMAAQEVLMHKRLIANIRAYLHTTGANLFRTKLFSNAEYEKLIRSFAFEEDFLQPRERQPMETLIPDQVNLVLSTSLDRLNSIRFFEKLVETILQQTAADLSPHHRMGMVEAITTKFEFIAT